MDRDPKDAALSTSWRVVGRGGPGLGAAGSGEREEKGFSSSAMPSLGQERGQGSQGPQTAVNFHFHFNWPWHTLDGFLHDKFNLLVISVINPIISWANIEATWHPEAWQWRGAGTRAEGRGPS